MTDSNVDIAKLRKTITRGIYGNPFDFKLYTDAAHEALKTLCDYTTQLKAEIDTIKACNAPAGDEQ